MTTLRVLLSLAFASVLSASVFAESDSAATEKACSKAPACCVKNEDGTKACTAADKAACCTAEGVCKTDSACKIKADGACPIGTKEGCTGKAVAACPKTDDVAKKADGCCGGADAKSEPEPATAM